MTLLNNERELLREATSRILENDPALGAEVEKAAPRQFATAAREIARAMRRPTPAAALEGMEPGEATADFDQKLTIETIVQKVGRPVLLVQDRSYRIDDPMLTGPGTQIWKRRLFDDKATRQALLKAIPAVGRVEVENNLDYAWVGTAWLIDQDIVATNRHVAEEFAAAKGGKFQYLPGFRENTKMRASIDFLEEYQRTSDATFVVKDILYIAGPDDPDVAFLKVENPNGKRAKLGGHLRLAKDAIKSAEFAATVGYPASDSRVPDQDLVKKFFGDVYDKKRLAPGQVLRERGDLLLHDCSTLGGNSGSCVVRICHSSGNGQVLGLHFSGLFLRENRAVPARVLADLLAKAKRPSVRPPLDRPQEFSGAVSGSTPVPATAINASAGGNIIRFNLQVPIELSMSVGVPTVVGGSGAGGGGVTAAGQGGDPLTEAVRQTQAMVAGNAKVLEVRRGFAFENGWITQKPAVVVLLAESSARASLALPSSILGFPVEVRDPGLAELMPQDFNDDEEGVGKTSYKRPPNFSLKEVKEKMKVVCHLSPDAGWPVLRDFLKPTKKRLTMGIYDFTAPHVVEAMVDAVKGKPKTFKLVMQAKESMEEGEGIKGNDWRETKVIQTFRNAMPGNRFSHVAASVGVNRQFASSYHIKVIVRDSEAFWLSSGNLQSSNQYSTTPQAGSRDWWHLLNLNREWNITIENKSLAQQFENYLKYDFDKATADEAPPVPLELIEVEEAPRRVPSGDPTYFKPLVVEGKVVKVMPLLSPDNYDKEVLRLIEAAEEKILFQNQSLNLQGKDKQGKDKNDPRFAELYEALLKKQKAGVDVRIIMRGDFNPETYVERLQDLGFDMGKVRLQSHCHTKGIVVDGKKVLIGSHNWTNEGTLANRDASLIFDDKDIAKYFADVFEFDWKKLAFASVGQPRRVRRVREEESAAPVPSGWRRTSLIDLAYSDPL